MKTNTEQMLRNPDIQPSSDVIAKVLGELNNAYIKFIGELSDHDYMSTTGTGENLEHWHVVVIKEQEGLFLRLHKANQLINITEHAITGIN